MKTRVTAANRPVTPTASALPVRVVIENVRPQVDDGRFPIKRIVGEEVVVEADIFTDGHDVIRCVLRHRPASDARWIEVPMQSLGNDRWRAAFTPTQMGRHVYTVSGWTDAFETWHHDLERREDPADILVALQIGARLLQDTAGRARGPHVSLLKAAAENLAAASDAVTGRAAALAPALAELVATYPDRRFCTDFEPELQVVVDAPLALFGAWYELFPRSSAGDPNRHGNFADCEALLPYVQRLGFDVLYLPPIHPIGRSRRKGPNNALNAGAEDPGSPWAIGAIEGGHRSIHP